MDRGAVEPYTLSLHDALPIYRVDIHAAGIDHNRAGQVARAGIRGGGAQFHIGAVAFEDLRMGSAQLQSERGRVDHIDRAMDRGAVEPVTDRIADGVTAHRVDV